MGRSSFTHRQFLCTALVACLILSASAQVAHWNSLLQSSPFGSPPGSEQTRQAAPTLEFRGAVADQDEYFFSIYEPATSRGLWVGLNETGNPFTVRAYDAAMEKLTVEYQGRTLMLTMKRAKIVASAPSPSVSVAASGAALPGATEQLTPTTATIERQIAEEIGRRRAFFSRSGQPPAG